MINSGSQAAKMENHGEVLTLSTVMVPTEKVFRAEKREGPARVGLVCMLSHFNHAQLCDPMDYSPPGSSVHGIL